MDIVELLVAIAIALVAVDIAAYTISVSLLGSHMKLNFMYIKRRLDETRKEIDEIQRNPNTTSTEYVTNIKTELQKFKDREHEFKNILFCLRIKGAVFYPAIFFIASLVSSSLALMTNITIYPEYWYLEIIVSILMLTLGSFRIFRTLQSIDFAATNVPLPSFILAFDGDAKSITLSNNLRKKIKIEITNEGNEIGEDIEVSIFFPPQFIVHRNRSYTPYVQPATSTHPNYTGIFYDMESQHVDMTYWFDVSVTPQQTGTFKIPAYICERKITQQEFELEIIVQ